MTKTAAPKVTKKAVSKRAKTLKLAAPQKVAAYKAVKAIACLHEYKNKMDWNIKLRHAIDKHVNDKKMAQRFSQALDYTYVFDLLREDESLPIPEYSEFSLESRDVSEESLRVKLTCKQLNSDVEVGVKIRCYNANNSEIEIGSF